MPKTKIKYTEILTAKVEKKHKKKAAKIGKGDMSEGVRKSLDAYNVD